MRMEQSPTLLCLGLPQPHDAPAQPLRKHRREATDARRILGLCRIELVQAAARQPPAKRGIDPVMPDRRKRGERRPRATLDPGDGAQ